MQHVGIGEDEVPARADGAARVLRRIAVVGEGADFVAEFFRPAVEFGELVLRKRLGGEQIQRARFRILDQRGEDGQVVAERFAGRRRRHDDDVAALGGEPHRLGLMRVEIFNAARAQDFDEF